MTEEQEHWHFQEPQTAWKGIGLYHITLTIPNREPLLGTLVIPDDDPAQAKVVPTPLGRTLVNLLWDTPHFRPEIQVLHYVLMPDHLHAIWYVRHKMQRGIASAVQGFWQGAKKIGRAYSHLHSSFTPTNSRQNYQEYLTPALRERLGEEAYCHLDPVFTEMPFIRPMGHRNQLPMTVRYLDMNPQRLATKRLKPGFLRVQRGIEIGGRTYDGVGNTALLLAGQFAPVHVQHTMVEAAEHGDNKPLRDYMNNCILTARNNTVMVSPFISPHEREVMNVLLREQLPFICLSDNGFGEYYKPQDSLFDACASGRVLILSPWKHDDHKRHITRAECVALNGMAEEICRQSSSPSH